MPAPREESATGPQPARDLSARSATREDAAMQHTHPPAHSRRIARRQAERAAALAAKPQGHDANGNAKHRTQAEARAILAANAEGAE